MKKLILILSAICFLLIPSTAMGVAGVSPVTQKRIQIADCHPAQEIRQLIFSCVGDSTNGSIPNKEISIDDLNFIRGWCLTGIEAYQTTVGTPPDADAASVFILDSGGMDLLGSEDGGTTAYAGLNLIHATLKRTCYPNLHLARAGLHTNYFPLVVDLLTLKVIDQATHSADYTIVLIFEKKK